MRQTFLALFAVLIAYSAPAAAQSQNSQSQPIEVSYEPFLLDSSRQLHVIAITAHIDKITIRNVRINRGNCLPSEQSPPGGWPLPLPKTLNFGQRFELRWFFPGAGGCQPIEVDVSTDKGDYTFQMVRY